jgi:predicted phage replisome organizer
MELADNNKRYYWLKLKEDFFGDKTIKKLRRIAGGDTYTVIYLKMLLKSLRDDGKLYYEGIESDFASELALDIDEDEENVKVTIQFLMSYGLLEQINEEEFVLAKCVELTGNECYSAERVRNLRNRQKKALQCNTDVTSSNAPVTECNKTVRPCNEEKEIEKEIEKELEIDIELENRDKENREVVCTNRVGTSRNSKPSPDDIVNLYNDICISYPQVVRLSEARKKAINARLKKYTLDDFRQLFETAEHNDFLKGANSRNWSATFDWLIADANMAKVLDGNYNSYKSSNSKVQNAKEQQKEEVQEHEQQQCDGIEFEKLDRLIDKGETLDSLRETSIEAYNGLPDWFEAYAQHYNTKYNPDGSEKVQM